MERTNSIKQEACTSVSEVTTHNRVRPKSNDGIFIIGMGFTPNKTELYKYFPVMVNRSSKTLYTTLCTIYAHPLRTANNLVLVSLSNYKTLRLNIGILLDLGYIQAESRPRKIVIYNAYVTDTVYRITRKGVKALSAITGY